MTELQLTVPREQLVEIVRELLPELLPAQATPTQPCPAPLVNVKAAYEFLGISETKLRAMCRARAIPFHKVDGSYRFDLQELHEATREKPKLKAVS